MTNTTVTNAKHATHVREGDYLPRFGAFVVAVDVRSYAHIFVLSDGSTSAHDSDEWVDVAA